MAELSKVSDVRLTSDDEKGLKTLQDQVDAFDEALARVGSAIADLRGSLQEIMAMPVMVRLLEIERRHNINMSIVDDHKRELGEHVTKLRHAFPFL